MEPRNENSGRNETGPEEKGPGDATMVTGKTLQDAGEAAGEQISPPTENLPKRITGAGGFSGWIGRHKLLAGIAIGVLVVSLLGGMFAIGYAVGRPEEKPEAGPLPGRPRSWREERPAVPPETFRDRRGVPHGETGILGQTRDELDEFIATKLGVSVDDLRDQLVAGKTVADLAKEKGVSVEELVTSVASKIEEIADRLASEKKITLSQAEVMKSRAESLASIVVHGGFRLMKRGL